MPIDTESMWLNDTVGDAHNVSNVSVVRQFDEQLGGGRDAVGCGFLV
jgi:hypothetical protein